MWMLNICIFASPSENGALILYFTKLTELCRCNGDCEHN